MKISWCENKINSCVTFFFRGSISNIRSGRKNPGEVVETALGCVEGRDPWLVREVCTKMNAFIFTLKRKTTTATTTKQNIRVLVP